MHHLRCVLVGDPCVGKTALVVAYTRNGFCERYAPTAFDNYSVTVCVDGNPLRLELCDTAGRSEFDSLRPLSYSGASVFLLCFNVSRPASLSSVTQRWLPEIRSLAPFVPVLLIGTQSDRRLGSQRAETVEPRALALLADQLRVGFLECSAVTHHNVKEVSKALFEKCLYQVFDLAILKGICHEQRKMMAETAPPQPPPPPMTARNLHNTNGGNCNNHHQQQNFRNNFHNFVPSPEGTKKRPMAERESKRSNGGKTDQQQQKGGTLKQNLWRLVSITKKALL